MLTFEHRNVLRGVSRRTVIGLAKVLDVPAAEMNSGRYKALVADEIFATSISYWLVPVAIFEG